MAVTEYLPFERVSTPLPNAAYNICCCLRLGKGAAAELRVKLHSCNNVHTTDSNRTATVRDQRQARKNRLSVVIGVC